MIYLYGAGSRCELVAELLKRKSKKNKFFITDDRKRTSKFKNFISKKVFYKKFNVKKDKLIICISNPTNYKKKYDYLKKELDFKDHEPIIDKNASIKSKVKIGKNTIILDNANIGPNTIIGKNVLIGVNSIINHDCKIGEFTTIGHGSNIASNVKISPFCFLGISSTVKNNIKINKNVLIGSASNVTKDCKSNSIYFGNPAKWKKKND